MTQAEWDRLLVTSFFERMDYPMWRLVWDLNDLQGLKRVPKLQHRSMTVARFVSGHIPTLARVLWNSNKSKIDEIVNALTRSRIDTQDRDHSHSARQQSKERSLQKKQILGYALAREAHKEHTRKMNNAHWNTCK